MKRRYYTKEGLRDALESFERHFGLHSEEFYVRYSEHALPEGLPRSIANTWAGIYEEYLHDAPGAADLASHVEKVLTET